MKFSEYNFKYTMQIEKNLLIVTLFTDEVELTEVYESQKDFEATTEVYGGQYLNRYWPH